MAITDYDCQVVIWCTELGELLSFEQDALGLTDKAANSAMAKNHEPKLTAAPIFPKMGTAANEALSLALGKLTDKSRLYICGHGDFGPTPKFAWWDAPTFAGLLKEQGLKHAKVISLVSCESGRDYNDDLEDYIIRDKPNSFAAQFHQALKDGKPELLTEVRAYTWMTGVRPRKGDKLPPEQKKWPVGTKLMTARDFPDLVKWVHKPKGYKISFYWENGKQHRRYMNKDGNTPID